MYHVARSTFQPVMFFGVHFFDHLRRLFHYAFVSRNNGTEQTFRFLFSFHETSLFSFSRRKWPCSDTLETLKSNPRAVQSPRTQRYSVNGADGLAYRLVSWFAVAFSTDADDPVDPRLDLRDGLR